MRRTSPRRPRPAARLAVEALEARAVPASLAGRVFLDFDNSGTAATPDTGVAGVTVTLSGGGLTTPLTQTTDSQGNFTFSNLAAGTYTLTESQPTSPANQSGKITAGTATGTVTLATNTVGGIVLAATTAATGYLFAEVPLVSTGGAVFEDTNGNGQKDTGEPGIPNVTVTLSGVSKVDGIITPKTATTDASGNYSFTGLTPGTYMIAESQPSGYSDGKEQNGTPAATVTDNRFMNIDLTKSARGQQRVQLRRGQGRHPVRSGVQGPEQRRHPGGHRRAGHRRRHRPADRDRRPEPRGQPDADDGGGRVLLVHQPAARLVHGPRGPADRVRRTGRTRPARWAAAWPPTTRCERPVHAGATATGYNFAEQPRADLRLTQTPASATINPGGTVTITYTLRNKGTATATAAAVTVNFGGLTFVSASSSTAFNATTKTWTVGDVAAGATQTIRLTFRGPSVGTFAPSAHATTTATELSTANNNSSSTISVGIAPPPAPAPATGPAWLANLWRDSTSTTF